MGLFTTLIRVMEFNQTPKGLNFPFCYQFIKRPASFNTFQKAEGASYSTLTKTPWFSTKPQATGKNWPWPHKDKNYWIILYKVEAPTCGHPIKTQVPAIDPITLTVFYFPLPYSSPPKYLKALENKVLLNIKEQRNWGRCELHRETKGHKDSWEEVKRKLHFTHDNDLTLAWKEKVRVYVRVWIGSCSLLNYTLSLYLYQQVCPYPLRRTHRRAECPQVMLMQVYVTDLMATKG